MLFFIYLFGGGNFRDFHLTVSVMIALIPEVRDKMWGWLQLPSVSVQIMHTYTMLYFTWCGRVLSLRAPTLPSVSGYRCENVFGSGN